MGILDVGDDDQFEDPNHQFPQDFRLIPSSGVSRALDSDQKTELVRELDGLEVRFHRGFTSFGDIRMDFISSRR